MIPAPGYVVDASVLVKWFMAQKYRSLALGLRELHLSGRSNLVVLELTFLEVLNAIRNNPKAKEKDAAEALFVLKNLHFQIQPADFQLLHKANAIAWTYGITIYDALYVALAEQIRFPLIAADEVLIEKLKGHSPVVALRELSLSG